MRHFISKSYSVFISCLCIYASLQKPVRAIKIALTSQQKEWIVEQHNKIRSNVTTNASNMLKMSWSVELERLATNYSSKCVFEHNENRKSLEFNSVGENLFVIKSTDGYPLFKNAIQTWEAEKREYRYMYSCISCGHYTQVIWATTYKVGCGYAVYRTGTTVYNSTSIVCNYGPSGNKAATLPYIGGPSCSRCPPQDVCENKLCANSTRDDTEGMDTPASSSNATATTIAPASILTTTDSAIHISPTIYWHFLSVLVLYCKW
uniref:peptidase inhibitor 16-like n=1 Tax=Styela clava TaxID=7725 RepID=UPI00193975C4|nr:peptidase inhibitor 16-like [Styela clava]